MTHSITERNINLRIIFPGETSLSVSTQDPHKAAMLRAEVSDLARKWMTFFQVNPKVDDGTIFEFASQHTLNYIDALEWMLRDIQSDPNTPDDVLDRINAVLR
jgi:hypothetical protein